MSATPPAVSELEHAGHALRQVLLRLNHYAQQQAQRADPNTAYGAAALAHLGDLAALLTAVEQYEQAALGNQSPPAVDIHSLTPAQLRAHREADPIYRLGWVRGHQAGTAQARRRTEPVLTAYATHAMLPEPTAPAPLAYTDLVQRVRAYLAQLQQRYGQGPISRFYSTTTLYGTH